MAAGCCDSGSTTACAPSAEAADFALEDLLAAAVAFAGAVGLAALAGFGALDAAALERDRVVLALATAGAAPPDVLDAGSELLEASPETSGESPSPASFLAFLVPLAALANLAAAFLTVCAACLALSVAPGLFGAAALASTLRPEAPVGSIRDGDKATPRWFVDFPAGPGESAWTFFAVPMGPRPLSYIVATLNRIRTRPVCQ